MTYSILDVVVLEHDIAELRLKRGDLGTVVEVYEPDGLEVEFVTAAGKTEAVATLNVRDVRPVSETDVVAARPNSRTA